MNVYTCVDHKGHWPVGVASVVVAESEGQARLLLEEALRQQKLKITPFTLHLLDTTQRQAVILHDGSY